MTPRPCPFCGAEPQVRSVTFGSGTSATTKWNVRCQSKGCPVCVYVYAQFEGVAVTLWNSRRADPDPPEPSGDCIHGESLADLCNACADQYGADRRRLPDVPRFVSVGAAQEGSK